MNCSFDRHEVAKILFAAVNMARGDQKGLVENGEIELKSEGNGDYIKIVGGYPVNENEYNGRLLRAEAFVKFNGIDSGCLMFWVEGNRIDTIEFASWIDEQPLRWPTLDEVTILPAGTGWGNNTPEKN